MDMNHTKIIATISKVRELMLAFFSNELRNEPVKSTISDCLETCSYREEIAECVEYLNTKADRLINANCNDSSKLKLQGIVERNNVEHLTNRFVYILEEMLLRVIMQKYERPEHFSIIIKNFNRQQLKKKIVGFILRKKTRASSKQTQEEFSKMMRKCMKDIQKEVIDIVKEEVVPVRIIVCVMELRGQCCEELDQAVKE